MFKLAEKWLAEKETQIFNFSIRLSFVPKGQLTVSMKTADNVSTLPALPNSTVTLTHCHCFTPPLSVYTKYKLQGCFRFCLVFTPSTPDHEKGTMSKKAPRGPFSSCHLKQPLACNLACQIACLWQNLEFITLYPNGKKPCLFEQSRNARQHFKQLKQYVCERWTGSELQGISSNTGKRFKLQSFFLYFSPHYLASLWISRHTLICLRYQQHISSDSCKLKKDECRPHTGIPDVL